MLAWQSDSVIERFIEAGLQKFTSDTIDTREALYHELSEIRNRGYATDDGEHQPGLICVGAPIRDEHGHVFAGISASGPAWKLSRDYIPQLAKIVVHHADQVSESVSTNA